MASHLLIPGNCISLRGGGLLPRTLIVKSFIRTPWALSRVHLVAALWLPSFLTAAETKPEPTAGTSARLAQSAEAADPVTDLITFSSKYTTVVPFVPGPYDGKVATLTAKMLQRTHYSREAMNDAMSARFLHRYLELLDPMHIHFVQADLREFERYGNTLDDLTIRQGNTSPANAIFARFLQRVEQRVEFVAGLMREEKFEFTSDDRYTPNRKDATCPTNLDEARQVWRQHLRYEYLQEKLNKQKPEQIIKTLSNRYKRLLRSWGELDSDDVLQLYLTSLANAYDPHSDYMGKAQLENFAISMKLSLFGIGALLRAEDDYCKIESLVPGGPAARSGKIKPNDRVISVQQKGEEPIDVVGWKLTKIVEMIRGPKGTEVSLVLIPGDAADPSERRSVTLIRDEIKLEDQEAKAKLIEVPAEGAASPLRLGIIDLPSFYASFDLGSSKGKSEPRSTTADVAKLVKKLVAEKVGGLILDLRRNGGGSLEEAIRLTGLFIREGPVVQVRDADGDVTVENDPDPGLLYDGPLVVLTSRFSASASEILAAALQDHGRAVVVGDSSTHGKGTVQTIYELNRFGPFIDSYNPGALKVTIRKFYRANGASTQLKGVTPDLVLPSVANYMEVGESAQELALPWDTIASAKFEKLNLVQPWIEELRRRSEARQSTSQDYTYVREDIDLYRKALADKSVSLNESVRLKEKEDADARVKARKEERKGRPQSTAKVYEVTLKLADQPGLPEPAGATNQPPHLAGTTTPAAPSAADPDDAAGETDEDAEDRGPVIDVALEEAERILQDFVQLSAGTLQPAAIAVTAPTK